MKIKTLVLIAIAAALVGCGTLSNSEQGIISIQEAVTIGTLAYINEEPKRAQEVVEFVKIAKDIQDEEGNIDSVRVIDLVEESIDYKKLDAYQVFALRALMIRIVNEINKTEINPKTKVKILEILDTAERVSQSYLIQ